ncbi:transcription termination factor NusA [Candidatus Roizmanbacteria bacterium RIFCSPLOWO2_02_FULL_37_19]|uniref:Transcription termination/antitermination protein NusA n=1 Tax=Candidatus Roizmanbacteria bacterium RIFCSPHIGHO2_02_FULL_37_24 TaxID=1802037 RepID=A0A1F7GZT4_9BACT|nr:MAG: transcription termination factor NusA [Candidatus Roizmanbacteria bacterium RIFCSPHIGHO2_01_FULL_38_41]OGK24012.1 MAG: transcription termination factor NusA [Candidatus Roizmanbacteria bacterium RIFCSPHIGHO2_02_FULL_37_24]OGK32374.1 MAG: transcription termination factor NusA [Candidatus Roizmanbacteria bacterium RIFCSPHIGHO2_12_FULL_37_23]OGK44266.1 MAG: transcription termination factor NusA [Candidatus Roizmanbacteria bacterium RIFCSPLOWO2_01_FULL_37_57]OGK53736.1 MAG: transcription te
MAVIKSEFFLALNQVATERGISPDDVLDSIRAAVMAAYKKDYGTEHVNEDEDEGLEVKINEDSGEMHILKEKKDITPPGFGRIAAQTARQVILQQIREAEKKTIVKHYTGQVGTIIKGRTIRFEGRNVLLDIGKAEGMLPVEEQIRSENYRLNDTLIVFIKEIKEDHFGNSRIIVSRSHPELVHQLFAKEVPEIASNTVKVFKVVREPGDRTKIAVHSDQTGVDPVGACVGQKGIRVKSVTDELGGNEKIDIIQHNEDDSLFIREALSPATVEAIEIDKERKHAKVSVSEEQAPLAIGKNGVNVNLASRLTGYEIDIVQMKSDIPEKPAESEKDETEEPAQEEKGEGEGDGVQKQDDTQSDNSKSNDSEEKKDETEN